MPKVTADVSEAKNLPNLKAGEYEVECTEAEVGTSSTGNPVVKIALTVIDGPDQGEDEEGRPIPDARGRALPAKSLPLGGKGAGILVNALEGFGVDYTKRGDKITFDPDDFKMKSAKVGIGQRQYQGDTFPDVKRFKPLKAAKPASRSKASRE